MVLNQGAHYKPPELTSPLGWPPTPGPQRILRWARCLCRAGLPGDPGPSWSRTHVVPTGFSRLWHGFALRLLRSSPVSLTPFSLSTPCQAGTESQVGAGRGWGWGASSRCPLYLHPGHCVGRLGVHSCGQQLMAEGALGRTSDAALAFLAPL